MSDKVVQVFDYVLRKIEHAEKVWNLGDNEMLDLYTMLSIYLDKLTTPTTWKDNEAKPCIASSRSVEKIS